MDGHMFNKNKYTIIKKAISNDLAKFCCDYFILKRQVAKTMFDTGYISQFTNYFGIWNDTQVPDTYSHYSDIVMETLLVKLLPIMEKTTGLKLNANYSYARIYKNGDVLKRHKDRFSCEISTTLNLGGDSWPIYLEPSGKENLKGIKVNLKQGDMLVYKGNELEHWREKFEGENCVQVFLHYNNLKTKGSKENIYDRRPHLGLPGDFKLNDK
jgi:hypothetical protein